MVFRKKIRTQSSSRRKRTSSRRKRISRKRKRKRTSSKRKQWGGNKLTKDSTPEELFAKLQKWGGNCEDEQTKNASVPNEQIAHECCKFIEVEGEADEATLEHSTPLFVCSWDEKQQKCIGLKWSENKERIVSANQKHAPTIWGT